MKNNTLPHVIALCLLSFFAGSQAIYHPASVVSNNFHKYVLLAEKNILTNRSASIKYADMALALANKSSGAAEKSNAFSLQLLVKSPFITCFQGTQLANMAYNWAIKTKDSALIFKSCTNLLLQKIYSNEIRGNEQLYEIVKSFDNPKHPDATRAYANYIMGMVKYIDQKSRVQAVPLFKRGLDFALAADDGLTAALCKKNFFNASFMLMRSDTAASRMIFEALDYFNKGGNTAEEISTYCYLGTSHRLTGNFAKARECYNKALALVSKETQRPQYLTGSIHNNFVQLCLAEKNYPDLYAHLKLAQQAYNKVGFSYGSGLLAIFEGQYYTALNDTILAIKSFVKLDSINRIVQSDVLTMAGNGYRGMLYNKIGRKNEGDSLNQMALKQINRVMPEAMVEKAVDLQARFISSEIKEPHGINDIKQLKRLYTDSSYRKKHKNIPLFANNQNTIKLLDSLNTSTGYNIESNKIISDQFNQQIAEQEAKYGNARLQDSLVLKTNETSNAKAQANKNARVTLATVIISIILAIGLFWVVKARRKALAEKKTALAAIDSEVAEKQKDMAHSIDNHLNKLQGFIEMAPMDRDTSKALLARIENSAQLFSSLYKGQYNNSLGIDQYIEELCMRLWQIFDTNKAIAINVIAPSITLPQKTTETLGSLINELVTNSYKHAFKDVEKGRIDIVLKTHNAGQYHLEVADNGKGLPATAKSNYEQKAIDGLVRSLRGNGNYINRDGTGTIFICTFPIAT